MAPLKMSYFPHIQGYNIISVLSLEIVPIMELLASMKTHSVPEDVDVSTTHTHTHTHKPIFACTSVVTILYVRLRYDIWKRKVLTFDTIFDTSNRGSFMQGVGVEGL